MYSDVTVSDRLRWKIHCFVSDIGLTFALPQVQPQASPYAQGWRVLLRYLSSRFPASGHATLPQEILSLKVSPFALKGIRSQPFPAMQVFNLPLDGARAYVFNSNVTDRLVWSSMACKQASAFRQGFLTVLLPFFSPVWEWVPGHRSHVTSFKVACTLRAPTVCSGLPDRPFCFIKEGPLQEGLSSMYDTG